MEPIIDPVPVELLKAELTPAKKLENTNKGRNELYVVTWQDSPNVVTEIGRLREVAFRQAGGSTGNAIDLDEYDKTEKPYKQLIVWDPDAQAILGGYRYILGQDVDLDEKGQPIMASAHQFKFSKKFVTDYLPYTMELGRSFVSPAYQSSKAGAKALFAMDNLWDGIAGVIMRYPKVLYFFGKVTIYPDFDRISRDLILHFLWKHFDNSSTLVHPVKGMELKAESSPELMDLVLYEDDIKEDYKLLKAAILRRGTTIPPLVNSYMMASPKIYMFGTAVNTLMNNIEDTAIMIPFDEIYEEKKRRHVGAFLRYTMRTLSERFPNLGEEMEPKLFERWINRRQRVLNRHKRKLNRRRK